MGKVLIACRDDEFCKKVHEELKQEGLTICSVYQEGDLLLEVLEQDFNVIIYDLDLSQLNGLKMVKILRRIRPKVTLIVIGSNPSTDLGARILEEGVGYYGVKPVSFQAIKEAVVRALTTKSKH